jgi:hypothetical protein
MGQLQGGQPQQMQAQAQPQQQQMQGGANPKPAGNAMSPGGPTQGGLDMNALASLLASLGQPQGMGGMPQAGGGPPQAQGAHGIGQGAAGAVGPAANPLASILGGLYSGGGSQNNPTPGNLPPTA